MTPTVKDPMIKFRSVIRGKNSKGGDRAQLYLTTEDATLLIETLTANLGNERGVKIDLHISKKEHDGRSFDSAIAFVKAVQEGMGARGGVAAPKSFTPKSAVSKEATDATVARIKAQALKG